MNNTFSERLKNLREHKGLLQTEVANAVGVTPAAISQFECGTREPSFEVVGALADALHTTTDYLVGRTEYVDTRMAEMMVGVKTLPKKQRVLWVQFYKYLAKKRRT